MIARLLLAGLICCIGAEIGGEECKSAEPASVETAETKARRVESVDFQLVGSGKWVVSPGKAISVPLALKVTNHTDKDLQLNLFDTIEIRCKDAAGKELEYFHERRRSVPPNPVVVAKGGSVSVDRSAKLEPVGNSADTFQLIGPDGAGGAWWFEGLKAGKYTLAIAFDDSSGDTRRFVKPVADTATTPFLTCKAATRELTFEIVIGE
jgi:hypothetical protein